MASLAFLVVLNSELDQGSGMRLAVRSINPLEDQVWVNGAIEGYSMGDLVFRLAWPASVCPSYIPMHGLPFTDPDCQVRAMGKRFVQQDFESACTYGPCLSDEDSPCPPPGTE